MRRTKTARIAAALVCLVVGSLATGANPDAQPVRVQIEPSKARVGLATVHLQISELELIGQELQGRYSIRVPIFPIKNDAGTLRLQLSDPLDHVNQAGGTLTGNARSFDDGATSDVVCTVRRDGQLEIEVKTPSRTMSFKSRLRTLQAADVS